MNVVGTVELKQTSLPLLLTETFFRHSIRQVLLNPLSSFQLVMWIAGNSFDFFFYESPLFKSARQ